MALVKCKECGQEVSEKAVNCPKCGAPLKKKTSIFTWLVIILVGLLFIGFLAGRGSSPTGTSSPEAPSEDKSSQIASWIESEVNKDGYNGCQCKALSANLVRCDLHFPAGTDTSSVEANVKGVAELFAQVGRLKATIYYTGYSGNQKVVEYKYDMYNATITKTI